MPPEKRGDTVTGVKVAAIVHILADMVAEIKLATLSDKLVDVNSGTQDNMRH